ncbi:MAG TPA: hypothetical protein VGM23_10745, partial [Armatimonadota bacterium]
MLRWLTLIAVFIVLPAAALAESGQVVTIHNQPMMSLQTFGETYNTTIDFPNIGEGFRITRGNRSVFLIPYS